MRPSSAWLLMICWMRGTSWMVAGRIISVVRTSNLVNLISHTSSAPGVFEWSLKLGGVWVFPPNGNRLWGGLEEEFDLDRAVARECVDADRDAGVLAGGAA